jgi:acetyltransferase
MLVRFTQIDYDREMALLVVTEKDGKQIELAVARYAVNPDGTSCEFALVVDDNWQHQGIGHKLMDVLMDLARAKGLRMIEGEVLKTNTRMLKLCAGLGFKVDAHPDDDTVKLISRAL